jgi:hypothetical protein
MIFRLSDLTDAPALTVATVVIRVTAAPAEVLHLRLGGTAALAAAVLLMVMLAHLAERHNLFMPCDYRVSYVIELTGLNG